MKFKDAPSDEGYMIGKISTDDKVVVGIYPVIFGYRIRVGYAGRYSYEIDYCGGDSKTYIETIYSLVLNILEQQDVPNLRVFPKQDSKPMNIECLVQLAKMASPELTRIELPDLVEIRNKYYEKYLS